MTMSYKIPPGSHVEVWGPIEGGLYVLSDLNPGDDDGVDYGVHKDPRELVKLARKCDCLSICHSYDLRRWPT